MKQVNPSNLELIHSCLTHFVKEPIININRFDDILMFQTASGTVGLVESNYIGNMNIWIGENVVYEIERELFDLVEYDRSEMGIIEFYNFLKKLNQFELKTQSLQFFNIVKSSTENIILNYDLPIVGDTMIEHTQIHYTSNSKLKINLN
jgi:hypothetical protein